MRNALHRIRKSIARRLVDWVIEHAPGQLRAVDLRRWNEIGLNVSRTSDYYSPLPIVSRLRESRERWTGPSALVGLGRDLEAMRTLLRELAAGWGSELADLPSYEHMESEGFGPGFHGVDAAVLYLMLRRLGPRRVIEVGSGVSTYVCRLAAAAGATDVHHTAIDPYPSDRLLGLDDVEVLAREVQDVPASYFEALGSGDLLLVDSTHMVRLDGDTPYVHLEVLPRLAPGVVIHVHDIPFPYNVPQPPDLWVLDRRWPFFWNEAMLVQAFLAFNAEFEMKLSVPLLLEEDPEFVRDTLPGFEALSDQSMGGPSSLWIERTGTRTRS